MSYGVGWFGRVFGALGMFGSVVFFVMEVCSVRDGPPPRNRPGRAAVFGPAPPNSRRAGNRNGNDLQAEKRMLILYLTC